MHQPTCLQFRLNTFSLLHAMGAFHKRSQFQLELAITSSLAGHFDEPDSTEYDIHEASAIMTDQVVTVTMAGRVH
jgi:hypothetical protein